MGRNILLCGDSEAGAVADQIKAVKRSDDLVRVAYVESSRIEDWGERLRGEVVRARGTDLVVLFLGTNHYRDAVLPSLLPLYDACESAPLYWVLPAKIHGEAYPINAMLKHALDADGALPHASVFDSSLYDFAMRGDGVHPTPAGALDWLRKVWVSLPVFDTSDLSDQFFVDLGSMCDRLKIEPVHLLFVMNIEASGVRAWADNGRGFSGLIQLSDGGEYDTLHKNAGFSGSKDDFKALSAEEQLPYCENFLRGPAKKGLPTAMRVWQALIAPATLDDTGDVIYRQGGTRYQGREALYYTQNSELDLRGKGYISTGDLQTILVRNGATNRFRQILHRYALVTGRDVPGIGLPEPLPIAQSRSQAMTAAASVVAAAASLFGVWYLSREDSRPSHVGARRVAA